MALGKLSNVIVRTGSIPSGVPTFQVPDEYLTCVIPLKSLGYLMTQVLPFAHFSDLEVEAYGNEAAAPR